MPTTHPESGGPVVYSVTATLPNADQLGAYLAWLAGGHVQAVLAGGASEARIIQLDDPGGPPRVRTQYLFASRERFEGYLKDHAPLLRAEGLARFGPQTGTRMDRELGGLVLDTRDRS